LSIMLKQLLTREYWLSRPLTHGDDVVAAIVMEKDNRAMRDADEAGQRLARPTFTALDRFRSKKTGLLVTVELDRDTDDFSHLVGKKIVVDGKMETCFSVERLPHAPPCRKGESVGLLIRKA
jgi:hypothetical protein